MQRSLPLSDCLKFRSHDLDESRESVAKTYCPHKITVHGSTRELSTELHEAPFSRSSLSYISYGASVTIDAGNVEDFYLVQVPWSGEIEVNTGHHKGIFLPGTASIVSPTNPLRMRWSQNSSHFTVKLSRPIMEARLSALLGNALHAPLVFAPVVELNSAAGRRWNSVVNFVRQQIQDPMPEQVRSALEMQLEDTMCLMLIELLRHNYSDRIHNIATTVAPKTVRRATNYILDNLQANISLDELASATAVSPATLSKHFRHYLGQSPLQYIRTVKLEAIHTVLKQSQADVSVAQIAMEYGFNHLGRFSQYYRSQFGQPPSATLRNS